MNAVPPAFVRAVPGATSVPLTKLEDRMLDAWVRADAIERVGTGILAGYAPHGSMLSGRANALTDSLIGASRIAAGSGMPNVAEALLQASQMAASLANHSIAPTGRPMPLEQQVNVAGGIHGVIPSIKEMLEQSPADLEMALGAAGSDDGALAPPPPGEEPPTGPGPDELPTGPGPQEPPTGPEVPPTETGPDELPTGPGPQEPPTGTEPPFGGPVPPGA